MIPVYSASNECLGSITDEQAQTLLKAQTAHLVRDRSGRLRRIYLSPADDSTPLSPAQRAHALAAYSHIDRYTYCERFPHSPIPIYPITSLKRFAGHSRGFLPYPST